MIRYHRTVDEPPLADAVKATGVPAVTAWLTGDVTIEGGVTGWVAETVTSSKNTSSVTMSTEVSRKTSVVFVVVAVKFN